MTGRLPQFPKRSPPSPSPKSETPLFPVLDTIARVPSFHDNEPHRQKPQEIRRGSNYLKATAISLGLVYVATPYERMRLALQNKEKSNRRIIRQLENEELQELVIHAEKIDRENIILLESDIRTRIINGAERDSLLNSSISLSNMSAFSVFTVGVAHSHMKSTFGSLPRIPTKQKVYQPPPLESTLHDLILEDNSEEVRMFLLDHPAVINQLLHTARGPLTPLMLAVSTGKLQTASVLMSSNANIDMACHGTTALDLAIFSASSNALEMLTKLLQYGKPSLKRAMGTAALSGRVEMVDLLTTYDAHKLYDATSHGSLLFRAIQSTSGEVVRKILNLDKPSEMNFLMNALIHASDLGSADAVEEILNYMIYNMADIHKSAIKDIKLRRLYDNCRSKSFYLRVANATEETDEIRFLKERYEVFEMAHKLLFNAAKTGQAAIIRPLYKILRANGTSADKFLNSDGDTALHVAARYGKESAVQTLLEVIDQETRNTKGQRPFDVATARVRMILDETYMDLLDATSGGSLKEMEMLLESGKSPNIFDTMYRTPLTEAVWQSNMKSVELLLHHKAQVHYTTPSGHTVMLWAQWRLEAYEHHQGDGMLIWLRLQKEGAHSSPQDLKGLESLRKASMSNPETASLLGYRKVFQPRHTTHTTTTARINIHAALGNRMAQGADLVTGYLPMLLTNYKPTVTLEKWLETLPKELLPNTYVDQLLGEARFFVASKVVEGYTEPPAHVFSLFLYTVESDLYYNMNIALRGGKEQERWLPFIYYLVEALRFLPDPGAQVLYRGISYNTKVDMDKYTPGSIVTWPAFSSASRSSEVSCRFLDQTPEGELQGLLFLIHSRTGKAVCKYSRYYEEEEFLFAPNVRFKVRELHGGNLGSSTLLKLLQSHGAWLQISVEDASRLECVLVVLDELE